MDTMGTILCEYTVNPLYTGNPSMDTMGTTLYYVSILLTLYILETPQWILWVLYYVSILFTLYILETLNGYYGYYTM